jgi:hypothetical protein
MSPAVSRQAKCTNPVRGLNEHGELIVVRGSWHAHLHYLHPGQELSRPRQDVRLAVALARQHGQVLANTLLRSIGSGYPCHRPFLLDVGLGR